MRALFGVVSVVCIVVSGCAAGIKGRSDSPVYLATSTESYYAPEIRSVLGEAEAFKKDYGVTGDKRRARNDFAYKMLEAYDLALQDYARALAVEGRGGRFAIELATIGLTAASTIISNSGTQAILSGIATALLGAEKGYSTELLADQTVELALVKMTASHLQARKAILVRLGETVDTYPLTAVELDLRTVGRVTSIEAALGDLTKEATKQLDAAEADVARVRIEFDREAAVELEALLCVPDTECNELKADVLSATQACVTETGLAGTRLVDLLDKSRTADRKKVVDCLKNKGIS